MPAAKNARLSLISRLSIAFNKSLTRLLLLFLVQYNSPTKTKSIPGVRRKHVLLSMATEKWRTHPRVFSQTLAHWNSKIEIDKETAEEGTKRAVSMERSIAGTKKIIRQIIYSLHHYYHIMVATPSDDFLQVLNGIPRRAGLSRSIVCTRHIKINLKI